MSKKIDLSFGSFVLHDNFTIGIINDGEDLKKEENLSIINLCTNHYQSRHFGYISHRKNSYSVDPTVYKRTAELPNLVAIALVLSEPAQKLSASIEKIFFDKPFEYFDSIEEAKKWMNKIVILKNQQEKIR